MITILCGKSASGKDTLLNELKNKDGFLPIISTTSRPIRNGELNGREYNFVSKEQFIKDIEENKFLEYRTYNTLLDGKPDIWYYGCPKETLDNLDPDSEYVTILDMNGTKDFVDYVGKDNCFVCYIYTDDNIREERAMKRESSDKEEWERSKKPEWDRRLKDDAIKFSDEILKPIVNVSLNNNTGDIEHLLNNFREEFGEYRHDIKIRTVTDIFWDYDISELMDLLEDISEEKAAHGMELPLETYKNMTYEERLDYLQDMLRHNEVSDYMLSEVLNMPSTVVIPKEVVKEAIECQDDEIISDWLSDEYGYCHEGFTLSEELENMIKGKEREEI